MSDLYRAAVEALEHLESAGAVGRNQTIVKHLRKAIAQTKPRDEWSSITEEEMMELSKDCWDGFLGFKIGQFARKVDQKLKEKNHD